MLYRFKETSTNRHIIKYHYANWQTIICYMARISRPFSFIDMRLLYNCGSISHCINVWSILISVYVYTRFCFLYMIKIYTDSLELINTLFYLLLHQLNPPKLILLIILFYEELCLSCQQF